MISGVYTIRNLQNDKRYVGSSADVEDRWRSHITRLNNGKHPNKKLQASWLKYGGEKSFEFRLIEAVLPDRLLLTAREQHWIDTYSACTLGYNIRPKAESCLGLKRGPQSEEHRRKNSEAKMGDKNPNYGKPFSEERKRKISLAQKGVSRGPHSEETKHTMSTSQKARYANGISEEHREQLAKAQKARVYGPLSEATKQKMREAHARRYANPC